MNFKKEKKVEKVTDFLSSILSNDQIDPKIRLVASQSDFFLLFLSYLHDKETYSNILESLIKISWRKLRDSVPLEGSNSTENVRVFPTTNHFYSRPKYYFSEMEFYYLDHYQCISKKVIDDLEGRIKKVNVDSKGTNKEREIVDRHYSQFIRMAVFLMAVYNKKIELNIDSKKGFEDVLTLLSNKQQLNELEKFLELKIEIKKRYKDEDNPFRTKYYFFYNRSHNNFNINNFETKVDDFEEDFGLGELYLIDLFSTKMIYHYKKKKLETIGRLNVNFDKSANPATNPFFTINSVKDKDLKDKRKMETFFLFNFYSEISRFKSDSVGNQNDITLPNIEDKVIFGITSSINRDKRHLNSTITVLIESKFYDETYSGDQSFDFYAQNGEKRNLKYLPKEIFLALKDSRFHLGRFVKIEDKTSQILPLDSLKGLNYLSNFQIPDNLPETWEAKSFIKKDGKDYLIISELRIEKNTLVTFTIPGEFENKQSYGNIEGAIKKINGETFIIIGLRYKIEYNFKLLHIYAKYDPKSNILKATFSGFGVIIDGPIGSKMLLSPNKNVNVKLIPILNNDNSLNEEVKSYIDSSHFKDFFLSENEYTNINVFSNLKQIVAKDEITSLSKSSNQRAKKVFISIPLIHNENKEEYLRNCKLIKELISEFKNTNILGMDLIFFCNCLLKDEVQFSSELEFKSYETYLKNSSKKNLENLFKRLSNCDYFLFLYPQSMGQNNTISSSIGELFFAIGCQKKVIIFVDEKEIKFLPKNIFYHHKDKCIPFNTDDPNWIKSIFELDIKSYIDSPIIFDWKS